MFFADFCMDPTKNLLDLLGRPEILKYYLVCDGTGTNSLLKNVNQALSEISNVKSQFGYILNNSTTLGVTTDCTNILQSDVNFIVDTLTGDLLAPILKCDALNKVYSDIVLGALCTSGMKALYNFWVMKFIIALILYVLMCFADAVYHTYIRTTIDSKFLTFDSLNEVSIH